jgi:hypothetical protein
VSFQIIASQIKTHDTATRLEGIIDWSDWNACEILPSTQKSLGPARQQSPPPLFSLAHTKFKQSVDFDSCDNDFQLSLGKFHDEGIVLIASFGDS